MTIEVIYRCSIYYDFPDYDPLQVDAINRISDKLADIVIVCKVNQVENSIGGPCFGPYFICESDNLDDMKKFEKMAFSYLKRWKKLRIEGG